MDFEKRLELISQVGEEIVTEEDLKSLLKEKKNPIAYDGFEPSGKVHIAQGLLRTININKMIESGCSFKMFVADWHAWANNKMGGDLEAIQKVGEYMIELWRACGLDMDNVEFIWASDLVKDDNYWKIVMNVLRENTIARLVRCSQIMGRSESDSLSGAQLLYPAMQAADMFYMGIDIAQLGIDQRKVNVLAREIGPKLGFWKPIMVSHHMLMGLGKPTEGGSAEERALAMKMSKSIPDSAIFMTDSEKDVKRKISKAYCPEREAEENPILEYMKYIIFERVDKVIIKRDDKFGGNLEFSSYNELEKAYVNGDIHPVDLKNSAASYINELLEPVREHFSKGKAKELLEFVEKLKITR